MSRRIPPPDLTPQTFREALRRLTLTTGRSPSIDMALVPEVLALHADYLTRDGGDGSARIPLGIAAVLTGCVRSGVLKDPDHVMQFAEMAVREWLIGHVAHFVPQPEDRESLRQLVTAIRLDSNNNAWPKGALEELLRRIDGILYFEDDFSVLPERFASQQSVGESPGAGRFVQPHPTSSPILAFVACAMTDPEADTDGLVEWAARVRSVLEDYGIVAFAPILERDPRVDRAEADDPRLYDIDHAMLAQSDLAIIRVHPPATGLGVVAEMASRFGIAKILIGDQDRTITPLLIGAHPAPHVLMMTDDFERKLRRQLKAIAPALRRHRDERLAATTEALEWLEQLNTWLSELSDGELLSEAKGLPDRGRFQAIRENAAVAAGMSSTERARLDRLMGRAMGLLSLDELRALMEGEAQGYWRRDETPLMVIAAISERKDQVPSAPRSALTHVSGWIKVRDRIRES